MVVSFLLSLLYLVVWSWAGSHFGGMILRSNAAVGRNPCGFDIMLLPQKSPPKTSAGFHFDSVSQGPFRRIRRR
jgi:hypothetical protein